MADIASFGFTKIMTADLSETAVSNIERTEMEAGPSKTVPKNSKGTITLPTRFLLTSAQYTTFKVWWTTTSKYGSLWFSFVDPRTNATVSARVIDGVYSAQPAKLNLSHYWLSLNLEVVL